jgi:hypothetical protein
MRTRIEIEHAIVPVFGAHPRHSRSWWLRTGSAITVAVAVIALIALSPFDADHSSRLSAPTEARAAFRAAAQATDASAWTPLRAGEYFHTMSTSFTPRIPKPTGDAVRFNNYPMAASARESFIDASGHGISMRIDGGNGRPDQYIRPMAPDRLGRILGFGWSGKGGIHKLQGAVSDSLRHALMVRTSRFDGTHKPTDLLWFRTKDGWKTGAPLAGGATAAPGLTIDQRRQRDEWGIPYSQVLKLNAASAHERDVILDKVLSARRADELGVSGPLPVGNYTETRKWFAQQVEVQDAIALLGRAPLSSNVRRALFQRLARASHVTSVKPDHDKNGRRGTRITFDWRVDEHVPRFQVTLADLVRDARSKFQPSDTQGIDVKVIDVPAHESYGRWYASIIIDEQTGAILQNEIWSEWHTSAAVPRLGPGTRGDGRFRTVVRHEPGYYGTYDGTVFVARDVQQAPFKPLAQPCVDEPRICR